MRKVVTFCEELLDFFIGITKRDGRYYKKKEGKKREIPDSIPMRMKKK